MSLSDLDSLVTAGRTAVRVGQQLGNALVPAGSRRAAALAAAGNAAKNFVFGKQKKRKRSGASARAGRKRPRKRLRRTFRRKLRIDYQGRLGPNFSPYVQKKAISMNQRKGYVIEYETGGAITDVSAVYVAHGMPARVLLEAVCGGITRMALKKFGLEIKGWEIGVLTGSTSDSFQWALQKQSTSVGGTSNDNSVAINGVGKAIDLALVLADRFMATTTNTQNFMEYTELRLIWTRGTAPVDYREEWRVMLSDLNVHYNLKTVLTLQNRTQAVKLETADVDQTNALDVAHNPLVGRIYYGKTTQINMKSMDDPTNNSFITLSPLSGLDTVQASLAATTIGAKKLPMWNDLTNVRGSTDMFVKAGEIRDSKMYISKSERFSSFIKKMMEYMRTANTSAAGTDQIQMYFPCRMLGFEKKIDSRTAGQPDVTVAFQLNYVLGARVTLTKRNAPLRVISV